MQIPKYIVFRVDVMRKGTSVELTNITDDVEDVILKAEQTEPQTDCIKCKHFKKGRTILENGHCHTYMECMASECPYEPKAEPQTDCAWR